MVTPKGLRPWMGGLDEDEAARYLGSIRERGRVKDTICKKDQQCKDLVSSGCKMLEKNCLGFNVHDPI